MCCGLHYAGRWKLNTCAGSLTFWPSVKFYNDNCPVCLIRYFMIPEKAGIFKCNTFVYLRTVNIQNWFRLYIQERSLSFDADCLPLWKGLSGITPVHRLSFFVETIYPTYYRSDIHTVLIT